MQVGGLRHQLLFPKQIRYCEVQFNRVLLAEEGTNGVYRLVSRNLFPHGVYYHVRVTNSERPFASKGGGCANHKALRGLRLT
jgi:hypothetical protein